MTWLDWFRPQKMSIITHSGMEYDICMWPQVEHTDIYNPWIFSWACDGEEMKYYKRMDSYDYLKSGSLRKKFQFAIKTRVVLK